MIEVGIATAAMSVPSASPPAEEEPGRSGATRTRAERRGGAAPPRSTRLMKRDWSRMTSIVDVGRQDGRSSSSRALTRSTTATVLVPDCFRTRSCDRVVRRRGARASAAPRRRPRPGRCRGRGPGRAAPRATTIRSSNSADRRHAAERPQPHLAAALVEPAAGDLDVLPLERGLRPARSRARRRRAGRGRRTMLIARSCAGRPG